VWRRASLQGNGAVFLGHWHSHLSGLWFDGNFAHPHLHLPPKPHRQLWPPHRQCSDSHRQRRRNSRQGPLRHEVLLQRRRSHPRSSFRKRLVQHGRHRLFGQGQLPLHHRPQKGPPQNSRRQICCPSAH